MTAGPRTAMVVIEDIAQRENAERALPASEERMRRIIETANDAFVALDASGGITDWNRQAEITFGWPREAVLGRLLAETIIPARDRDAHRRGLERFLATGEGPVFDTRLELSALHRDGHEFPVELTVWPTRAGTTWTFNAFVRDITARRNAEADREELLAAAERARVDAEAANRVKDQFLAMRSHELRSPLGAIRTWASLLRTGKLDAERSARAIEAIERNVVTQARLIEDLLDVSRISAGKLVVREAVDLVAAAEAALDAVQEPAGAKSIRVEKRVEGASIEVLGDLARLQQVVWNLLSNAIKFSPREGRVVLRLSRTDGEAVLSVEDEGEGIDAGFLPSVFAPFRQADSTRTRSHGGLGLGLAIVRHLVELHGGTVTAASPGKGLGATFTVRLPLREDRREAATVVALRPAVSGRPFVGGRVLDGVSILVVDDDAEARDSIAAVLEHSGARVLAVASAREALEALERQAVDVLISDVAMPGMDGHALLCAARASGYQAASSALALTAYAGADERRRALAASSGGLSGASPEAGRCGRARRSRRRAGRREPAPRSRGSCAGVSLGPALHGTPRPPARRPDLVTG